MIFLIFLKWRFLTLLFLLFKKKIGHTFLIFGYNFFNRPLNSRASYRFDPINGYQLRAGDPWSSLDTGVAAAAARVVWKVCSFPGFRLTRPKCQMLYTNYLCSLLLNLLGCRRTHKRRLEYLFDKGKIDPVSVVEYSELDLSLASAI